jgi:Zn-dependent peptidase ImmA (M78 family)/DNA-binding XRE family transcriptional regulator
MSETTAWVAEAIREARERRGFSQSELARRLDLSQTAISYWEAGKRDPGLDDLIALSQALDVTVDVFFPPQSVRRPVTALLRATAERLADTELEAALGRMLDRAERAQAPPRQIEVGASAPTTAANELLEKAQVFKPAVDADAIAAACGVIVIYAKFPDSLSGLVFEYEEAAVIGINSRHHVNRRRFSLAHELGHYLLGHHRDGHAYEERFHIDTADGTPPGYNWRAERAANDFAAELLMPRRLISRALRKTEDPERLSAMFEVSSLAMGYRLVDLGLR